MDFYGYNGRAYGRMDGWDDGRNMADDEGRLT